jgi:DNA end-binding protein Ku
MARAIWKGSILIGEQSVPVKLYSAVQDHQIRFHLLHERDGARVRQKMVDPSTGDEVSAKEIRRGYPVEPGVFVVIKPEELAALEPPPSREIEISRFVPAGSIDPQWYDRPYFLGPDGSSEPYFALHEALQRQERAGIARWVMRKRRYSGAIRAHGDHLVVLTLRHAEQIIDASKLEAPAGRAMDSRELALAEQLVSALEGEFDPTEFEDDYRNRVLALIEAKAKGKVPKLKPLRARKPTSEPLAGVLQASLRQLRHKERESA